MAHRRPFSKSAHLRGGLGQQGIIQLEHLGTALKRPLRRKHLRHLPQHIHVGVLRVLPEHRGCLGRLGLLAVGLKQPALSLGKLTVVRKCVDPDLPQITSGALVVNPAIAVGADAVG